MGKSKRTSRTHRAIGTQRRPGRVKSGAAPRQRSKTTPRHKETYRARVKLGQTKKRSGAGAATTAGTTFQEDVAAWAAVQILAEQAASPGFGLPESVTLEGVSAESFQPVDDLSITTSDRGQIFLQCKTSVTLSRKPDSSLSKVIRQFVRQLVAGCLDHEGAARPLDPARDRLILAVAQGAASSVTKDLANAVETVGSATTPDLLRQFQSNRDKREQSRSLDCSVALRSRMAGVDGAASH